MEKSLFKEKRLSFKVQAAEKAKETIKKEMQDLEKKEVEEVKATVKDIQKETKSSIWEAIKAPFKAVKEIVKVPLLLTKGIVDISTNVYSKIQKVGVGVLMLPSLAMKKILDIGYWPKKVCDNIQKKLSDTMNKIESKTDKAAQKPQEKPREKSKEEAKT